MQTTGERLSDGVGALSSGSWLPDLLGSTILPAGRHSGPIGIGGTLSFGSWLPDLPSPGKAVVFGRELPSGGWLPDLSPPGSTVVADRDFEAIGVGGRLSSGSWWPDVSSPGNPAVSDRDRGPIGMVDRTRVSNGQSVFRSGKAKGRPGPARSRRVQKS